MRSSTVTDPTQEHTMPPTDDQNAADRKLSLSKLIDAAQDADRIQAQADADARAAVERNLRTKLAALFDAATWTAIGIDPFADGKFRHDNNLLTISTLIYLDDGLSFGLTLTIYQRELRLEAAGVSCTLHVPRDSRDPEPHIALGALLRDAAKATRRLNIHVHDTQLADAERILSTFTTPDKGRAAVKTLSDIPNLTPDERDRLMRIYRRRIRQVNKAQRAQQARRQTKLAEAAQIIDLARPYDADLAAHKAHCAQLAADWTAQHIPTTTLWRITVALSHSEDVEDLQIVTTEPPPDWHPSTVDRVYMDGSTFPFILATWLIVEPIHIEPATDRRIDYCAHHRLGDAWINIPPGLTHPPLPHVDPFPSFAEYLAERLPDRTLSIPENAYDFPHGCTALAALTPAQYIDYYDR